MSHQLTLTIASVDFRISCSEAAIRVAPDRCYAPFFGVAGGGPEAVEVDVRLHLGRMPCTDGLPRVFDTGASWAMFSDGDGYCVTMRPPAASGEPLWVARIARDFLRASVHCGSELIVASGAGQTVANPVRYPLDQIMLVRVLGWRQGALIHAAGVDVGGRGFIFAGRSGAGKSTLCRRLAGRKGMELLSDDRIAVRRIGDRFMAYGTPWAGDQGTALNRSMPLCGICFLRHADGDKVVRLDPRQALERLLPVASIPWYDRETVTKILSLCDDLLAQVPTFELQFRADGRVAEVLEELAQSTP